MKITTLVILPIIILAGISYFIYIFEGIGSFRKIEERPLEVVRKIELFGPEDFEISYSDSFAIISSTERKKYPPEEEEFGDLYFLDLKSKEGAEPINLTENLSFKFSPHGLSLFKLDSTYLIKVINHSNNGHSIEEFELFSSDSIVHHKTFRDSTMEAPNDIVHLNASSFYFTNDVDRSDTLEVILTEFLGIGKSSVIFFDGNSYRTVSKGIAFANGINILRDKNLLLVGASRGFKIHAFSIQDSGDLEKKEVIKMPMGVDNIAIDNNQNIWAAGHPSLPSYMQYGKRQFSWFTSPSEVVKIKLNEDQIEQESIFVDKGEIISGSTIACPFGDFLMVGSALDNKLLFLKN